MNTRLDIYIELTSTRPLTWTKWYGTSWMRLEVLGANGITSIPLI